MSLKKPDFEKDVVYLVQLPRVKFIPSLSPYCLKLETWLRIADIKYEGIAGELTTKSKKGQVPFVELNGKELDDSYFIINSLTQIFHKEDIESHMKEEEAAIATAFESLIEGSLVWVLISGRLEKKEELLLNPMMQEATGAKKMLKPLMSYMFGSLLKKKLFHQGMGRHSPEEVLHIGKRELKALSDYLGKKKFMNGKRATRLDATAFGHLSQFWYLPEGSETEIKKFMGAETPNLVEYLERMKSTYWPDWDEACSSLSMNTKWKSDEDEKK